MKLNVYLLCVFYCIKCSNQSDVKGFDDTILFEINWPGELLESTENSNQDSVLITTAHQEKYSCILPSITEEKPASEGPYEGPSALEYLSVLFSETQSCTFRLESYWTYEICHGRYIRQYHEDREGKKVKLQQYYLGRWDETNLDDMILKAKNEKTIETNLPTKKIDNVYLPYFEIVMGNGTLCELNENKPRETRVLYVCYIYGKHEVYSLKETSTCVYEIIILSPLLCSHPKYKPKETGVHNINCIPQKGFPDKPYAVKLKEHNAKLQEKEQWNKIKQKLKELEKQQDTIKALESQESKVIDTKPVQSFLQGKDCLNGGTGWWKFEFCYGKHVEQFHIEKDNTRLSINLGKFNKQKHLKWLELYPHKRPKPISQRKQLSHFYSEGSICDKTGKPRQTEVKLKCLEKPQSPNVVSLYLLEPKYCEYILGVESPLICDILPNADENGLVEWTDSMEEEKLIIDKIKIKLKL